MLDIEPSAQRAYKVGDWVTYIIKVANRGPAAIEANHATLHISINEAVTEFDVSSAKNLGCAIYRDSELSSVRCGAGYLGPGHTRGSVKIKAKIPAALADKQMVAVIARARENRSCH